MHLIPIVRLRYCQRTRAYPERRAREGKSKRDIIRCLKRHIAREVYNILTPRPTRQTTTILCGSPGVGTTRKRS